MKSKKGIATWITQMLVALIAIGAVAFMYFLFYGRYFDIHVIVISNEAQRHAINIAQVILSSDKLVYEETFSSPNKEPIKRFNRGVFDTAKLNSYLMLYSDTSNLDKLSAENEFTKEIGYPNSYIDIVVVDLKNGDKWMKSYSGPEASVPNEYWECLWNNVDDSFFGSPNLFNAAILWDFWDITECTATFQTKIGTFVTEFPVMIRSGDSFHTGRLMVRTTEL